MSAAAAFHLNRRVPLLVVLVFVDLDNDVDHGHENHQLDSESHAVRHVQDQVGVFVERIEDLVYAGRRRIPVGLVAAILHQKRVRAVKVTALNERGHDRVILAFVLDLVRNVRRNWLRYLCDVETIVVVLHVLYSFLQCALELALHRVGHDEHEHEHDQVCDEEQADHDLVENEEASVAAARADQAENAHQEEKGAEGQKKYEHRTQDAAHLGYFKHFGEIGREFENGAQSEYGRADQEHDQVNNDENGSEERATATRTFAHLSILIYF